MTGTDLTLPTGNTRGVSLRDRSTSDLIQAIHSPGDEEYVLNRTRDCLRCFYEPDMDHEARAAMMDEFRRALRDVPRWAVARAYDDWMKQHKRRPSPAEIRILAQGHIKSISNELKDRQPPEERRDPSVTPEEARKICEAAGFTPKTLEAVRRAPMARSVDEAMAPQRTRRPHWTETVAPDSPEMEALRRARAANSLMGGGA